MVCGKDYLLSPENLGMLGALDDALNAYYAIQSLHEQVCSENINPQHGCCTISPEQLKSICLPRYKRILNVFFGKHYNIFSETYQIKYVNNASMRGISFVKFKHPSKTRMSSFTARIISFEHFLFEIESIAVALIHQRSNGIKRERIWDDVDSRIRYLSATTWKDRIQEYDNCDDVPPPPNLIVFKTLNTVSCRLYHHDIIPDTCLIPLTGNNKRAIRLPVHKCNICGRIFIGEATYKVYNSQYGLLFFRKQYDDQESNAFIKYAKESKLHSYGYNVIDGELSEKERFDLLIRLLESHSMTYMEICKDIENAIRIFENNTRFIVAIRKWDKDLKALGDYVIEHSIAAEAPRDK